MANTIQVAATNGPLQVGVVDFKDVIGNPASPPEAPNWVVSGPATIEALPGDGLSAQVTLLGAVGEVVVEARFSAFTVTGTIYVVAGYAASATLNISA